MKEDENMKLAMKLADAFYQIGNSLNPSKQMNEHKPFKIKSQISYHNTENTWEKAGDDIREAWKDVGKVLSEFVEPHQKGSESK